MRGLGVAVVLGIGLMACGGSSSPPRGSAAAEPGPTCADVAAHVQKKLEARVRGAPDVLEQVADRFRRCCTEDGWTVESRRCFVSASLPPELDLCFAQLTKAQQSALVAQHPPRLERNSMEGAPRSTSWEEERKAWDASFEKYKEERRAWEELPVAQRGPAPEPPPPPSPSPSPSPNVAPQVLEARRSSGEKLIVPDDVTKAEISQSGKNRLIGSYKLCITTDGNIKSVNLLKSIGVPAYDWKIQNTIRNEWHYRPFLVNGKAVEVCTVVTFIYTQAAPPPPPPSKDVPHG